MRALVQCKFSCCIATTGLLKGCHPTSRSKCVVTQVNAREHAARCDHWHEPAWAAGSQMPLRPPKIRRITWWTKLHRPLRGRHRNLLVKRQSRSRNFSESLPFPLNFAIWPSRARSRPRKTNAYETATKGTRDYGVRLIEAGRTNLNAAFDYATELLSAKSPSEAIELSTAQLRKQLETLSEQSSFARNTASR